LIQFWKAFWIIIGLFVTCYIHGKICLDMSILVLIILASDNNYNFIFSSVIASNFLLVDEIMRAGRSSLKNDNIGN
jgi:hypothetical protein